MSRNIQGDVNCSGEGCGKDISTRYWMCDEESMDVPLHDSREFCDVCFAQHPCGKGEHGESCATLVTS